jgi:hypothetical protein
MRLFWGESGMKVGKPSPMANAVYGKQWAPITLEIEAIVMAATLVGHIWLLRCQC